MYINQTTSEEIKSRADVLSVVEDFPEIKLKKSGARYVALSPFTEENTPSFYITPSKNIFHCFSSGKGGDAIAFLMEYKNLDYPNALLHLAKKYNIEVKHETPTPEEQKALEERSELYKLNRAAQKAWQKCLLDAPTYRVAEDHPANYEMVNGYCAWPQMYTNNHESFPVYKELIEKRQRDVDTIIQFGLGYAPDSWKFLYPKVKEAGMVALASKLGLVKKGGSGTYYDFFRHRITYPIHNHKGHLVGFSARALEQIEVDGKTKFVELIDGKINYNKEGNAILVGKTINSAESDIFKKDEILYGLHIAQDAIRKAGVAYVCEGPDDVISMHQMQQANTVGTLGTALTKKHLALLSNYCNNICLLYDGDEAGRKAAMKAADMAIREGFGTTICLLPEGEDPDSFARTFADIGDFALAISKATKHAILQIAHIRADEIQDPLGKEKLSQELANLIANVAGDTIKDDLTKKISKAYEITPAAFRKMVANNEEIYATKEERKKIIARKNEITKLEGDPSIYPYFEEQYKTTGSGERKFKGIDIKRVRLIELLKSFGYSRYKLDGDDAYTFILIKDNLLEIVTTADIMDRFERYVWKEYDYETACELVHAEMVMEKVMRSPRSYFSPQIFERVVSPSPIIIHKDTKNSSFFYYKNGFVEINADGWKLRPYNEMEGGIWANQSNDREFKPLTMEDLGGTNIADKKAGTFANFVWLIADEDLDRFYSLCSIIGYTLHDYYDTDLKAISLTDSSLSAESDGRSGKTLLFKMLGHVRKVVDINGKNFSHDDDKRYNQVDIDTQAVAINDIQNKGRNKFSFENMFNDITEGAMVKKLYMNPFRKFMKFWILTNAPLEIHGGSQEDRIVEFELSQHFSKNHKPKDEYGIWFGRDYDAMEWAFYDNFMCFCSWMYHTKGIIKPSTINLDERKLRNETTPFFLTFMEECDKNLKEIGLPWKEFQSSYTSLSEEIPVEAKERGLEVVKIDKNKWYERIQSQFKESNEPWFKLNFFTKCLRFYAKYRHGIEKPYETRSNNINWFMFHEGKEVAQ